MSYDREYAKKWRENNPDYHRQWVKRNPDKKYFERSYKYQRNNPVKRSARNAVYYALKKGKIIKPEACENCNDIVKLEADHHDYTKKLDVRWFCKPCHVAITVKRRLY